MRKFLLLISLLHLSLQGYSSHLMGGQITAAQIIGRTYSITLTLYRDTLGIPISNPDNIKYFNTGGSQVFPTHSVPAVGSPYLNGTEEYVYSDTVTFPHDGSYTITFNSCCRNAAISNMSNPGNEGLYLNTIVMVDS